VCVYKFFVAIYSPNQNFSYCTRTKTEKLERRSWFSWILGHWQPVSRTKWTYLRCAVSNPIQIQSYRQICTCILEKDSQLLGILGKSYFVWEKSHVNRKRRKIKQVSTSNWVNLEVEIEFLTESEIGFIEQSFTTKIKARIEYYNLNNKKYWIDLKIYQKLCFIAKSILLKRNIVNHNLNFINISKQK